MENSLKNKCDLLVQNRKVFSETFMWASSIMNISSAYLFTSEGILIDEQSLKVAESILKDKAGFFSDFRGNVKNPLICKMILSKDPEGYFDRIETIYKCFSKNHLFKNEYMVLAAITISDHVQPYQYEAMVDKTESIYKKMKEKHPLLTSSEDVPFAAMLAVSDLDEDVLIDEMESCYRILKERFFHADAIQTLSHVLSIDPQDSKVKCLKVEAIFDECKAQKHKFGTGFELSVLGPMAMLDLPAKQIASYICEVDDYLKEQKGFGSFSLDSHIRRLFAAQLVLHEYGTEDASRNIVLASTLAITIALEICMIVIVSSSVSASSH